MDFILDPGLLVLPGNIDRAPQLDVTAKSQKWRLERFCSPPSQMHQREQRVRIVCTSTAAPYLYSDPVHPVLWAQPGEPGSNGRERAHRAHWQHGPTARDRKRDRYILVRIYSVASTTIICPGTTSRANNSASANERRAIDVLCDSVAARAPPRTSRYRKRLPELD